MHVCICVCVCVCVRERACTSAANELLRLPRLLGAQTCMYVSVFACTCKANTNRASQANVVDLNEGSAPARTPTHQTCMPCMC